MPTAFMVAPRSAVDFSMNVANSAGVYVLINLLIDLSYQFFDPRIRY